VFGNYITNRLSNRHKQPFRMELIAIQLEKCSPSYYGTLPLSQDPVLSHKDPVHTFTLPSFEKHFNITFSRIPSRSRLPSSLRYALSSLIRKPGSWVRITLRTWIFGVCVCVYVIICVRIQVEALRRADHPPKESY
jgi:hypothetical protein